MARNSALPHSLPPRLISREAAAAYVNLSPNTFDLMVEQGTMPKARIVSAGRIAWDVRELDLSVDALPYKGQPVGNLAAADEGWDDAHAA